MTAFAKGTGASSAFGRLSFWWLGQWFAGCPDFAASKPFGGKRAGPR